MFELGQGNPVTYLAKAGLLVRPSRGKVAITDRGKDVLASHPPRVDVAFLLQYPEFEVFRTKTRPHDGTTAGLPIPTEKNPEELLYATYETLREAVEADLLERVQSEDLDWGFFELRWWAATQWSGRPSGARVQRGRVRWPTLRLAESGGTDEMGPERPLRREPPRRAAQTRPR